MDIEIPFGGRNYVLVPVIVDDGQTDPTDDVVEMQFLSSGAPEEADWIASDWLTVIEGGATVHKARCLVGTTPEPGDATLDRGTYRCWVRVTDNPEIPILRTRNRLVIA